LLARPVAARSRAEPPQAFATARVSEALAASYSALLQPHTKWWARFWEQSAVSLPDPRLARHYYLVRYFYGAASRAGAPPMPLQGVWTADAGALPPWKGDYHNDLNTQMTYLGYLTAGQFEEGRCFLDFNWNLLPAYRRFARDFFGTPGANVPGVMSLSGDPLTGWPQYALSPTMSAWIAHLFYLHWRYTLDETFLKERAYPWCAEVGESLLGLLAPDEHGKLKLPLSSSPEIFDNSLRAWLPPNSNFDLALLRWLFGALAEMAAAAEVRLTLIFCSGTDRSRRRTYRAAPRHICPRPSTRSPAGSAAQAARPPRPRRSRRGSRCGRHSQPPRDIGRGSSGPIGPEARTSPVARP
jgi:alpha-L-fucosidase 2